MSGSALAPDESISHYRIVSLLGAGGMGEVYLAHDTQLDRAVALKVLPAEIASDEQRMQRFTQEAKTASGLNHPNILTIYEIGQSESTHFIATEFVRGATLRDRMAQGPMAIGEALDVGMQTASALAAAHEAGVVHRDIKPENIMLREDGFVKVLDFGLAKLLERESKEVGGSEQPTRAMHKTAPGMVLGTVSYMSPEQASGLKDIDERADVWSLGIVIYEMIANRVPFGFDGATPTQILSLIIQKEAPSLKESAPGVPDELSRIVMKSLENKREDRYQSMKELLVDLRRLNRQLERDAEKERSTPPELRRDSATGGTRDLSEQGAPSGTSVARTAQPTSSAEYLVTGIKRHKLAALAGVVVLVLGLVALLAYLHARNTEVAIESIAVLPFDNQNRDPDTEYLSDGLTESIINSLTRLPNLKVIPRSMVFRYKGKTGDPQRAGGELRVNAVLTGRVVQRGDNLTISVELEDVRYGKQLWGEQYNRKLADLLAVHSEIAREISQRLRSQLTGDERRKLIKGSTENPEAYQLYLRGNYYASKYTKEGLRKGIDYFNQAIAADPNYALAYNGLAFYYIAEDDWYMSPKEAMPRAREAAKKALAIDDSLADGHASLAVVAHWYDWDWAAAEREYRRALELNPNDARSREYYGWFLINLGRVDEGIGEANRGQQLDPISPEANAFLGSVLMYARHYDQAIEQLRKTVELDSTYWLAHDFLGQAYEANRNLPAAIVEFQRALQLEDAVLENRAHLGRAYALAQRKDQAKKITDQFRELPAHSYLPPYCMAIIYAGLDDKDQAFAWLDRACTDRSYYLVFLSVDPQLDNLRSDPRFADLLRRVGLPGVK